MHIQEFFVSKQNKLKMMLEALSVSLGYHNKVLRLGGLYDRSLFSQNSHFWGVQDEGAS